MEWIARSVPAVFLLPCLTSLLINIHEKNGTRERSPDNRKVRIIEVQLYMFQLLLYHYLSLEDENRLTL